MSGRRFSPEECGCKCHLGLAQVSHGPVCTWCADLRDCQECGGKIMRSVFGRRGGGSRWVHCFTSDWHPSKGGRDHQAVPVSPVHLVQKGETDV